MGYLVGTIRNQRLFIRCPMCGDSSKRPHVGHLGIDLTQGLYHCHRCGEGGRLSSAQFVELTSPHSQTAIPPDLPDLPDLSDYAAFPDSYDARYTLLISQQDSAAEYRQWPMRKADGGIIGYHHRYIRGKYFQNIGYRGLGYPGKCLLSPGILRVVEGPYDVVLPDSVCVFGKITLSSLRLLRHYRLCLCPDNDIIYNSVNLRAFARVVEKSSNVEYVEVLSRLTKDPADLFKTDKAARGKLVTRQGFLKGVARYLKNSKIAT